MYHSNGIILYYTLHGGLTLKKIALIAFCNETLHTDCPKEIGLSASILNRFQN